jgi:hypothetical protein
MYVSVSHQPQRGVVEVSQVCEALSASLTQSVWLWKAVEVVSYHLPSHTVAGWLRQFFSIERTEKGMCATLRDGTSALPLAYVSTNHKGYSKRHRLALGMQLQLAEPETFSQTARLMLTTATQRSPTATDGTHTSLRCPARRSDPSAPCFDVTSTLGRLCAKPEVGAKMDSSDEAVDSTVYRAHEIVTYGCFGGKRAG